MVQLTLPRGSDPVKGKAWPKPDGAKNVRTFKIYRYDPESGNPPSWDTYKVDLDACGPMVLDAILWIKNNVDATLAFRRSCREGVCGSCAMNIGGGNTIACTAGIDDYKGTITISPLPHQAVVRDLIPDLTQFYAQHAAIKPYLQTDTPAPEKEWLQSPTERAELDGAYECIMCACCSNACPPIGGMTINISGLPPCSIPIAGWPTAATRPRANASTSSTIRSNSIAATPS